ncbi:Arc family DNA-binding protein [Paracoccus sp. IB05]|uniref:Arc family DNA-binding protein n=1 Tax=Paracoccus sp. IB05 TaxID=2779367 RepID=UPI001A1F2674|nr:Arc family DNA-binding protein [Paracoccus sp. IB05]MBJ2151357.1 Arc family DNA-binding protein [Paracoccus sp. IB05]
MAHSHHCVNLKLWLYAIMTERKPQTQDKFILRLPDGMRERIKAAAEANNRSMNSEVLALLEEKFPVRNVMGDAGKWIDHIHAAESEAELDQRLAEANTWAMQFRDRNVIGFEKLPGEQGSRVMIVVDRYRPPPVNKP